MPNARSNAGARPLRASALAHGLVQRQQIPEHLALRVEPVARLRSVERRLFDGIFSKFRRDGDGPVGMYSAREAADQGARVNVARSVEGAFDLFRFIAADLSVVAGVKDGGMKNFFSAFGATSLLA